MTGKPIVVLRRRFDSAFGWLVSAGMVVMICVGLLSPWPGHGFVDQLDLPVALAPVIWVGWMATAHPAVKIYESDVLVVNWFHRYWVPWAELVSVESADEVNIVTRSGERVSVASGAASLASSLMGNKAQDRNRDAIEHARPDPAPVDGGGVRKGFDLCLWQFGVLVVFLLAVAWLGVYSPV